MNIIKVASTSRTSAVAGAIAGIYREEGCAEIQAIGAGAVNQAIKAITIAKGYLAEEGKSILFVPSFVEVEIGGEMRTAVRFSVNGGLDEAVWQALYKSKSETAVMSNLLSQQVDSSKPPPQIEAVLIIDDNISLHDFLADIFSTIFLVNRIYTATNGAEGLKIFQQQKHHIILIVLDIEMPIMNGPQTYKKLRQIAPHVRVIVSSALNHVDAQVQFDEQTLPVYLKKPYNLETLLKIVYSEFAAIRDTPTKLQLSQALMIWDDDGGQQGNIFAG